MKLTIKEWAFVFKMIVLALGIVSYLWVVFMFDWKLGLALFFMGWSNNVQNRL